MGAIERDVVVTGLRGGVGAALARDLLLLGAPRVWLHHPSATDAVRATDVDASAGILRADDVDAPLVGAVARRLRAYGDVDVLGPEPLDAGATALADAAAVCACDGAGPLATSAGVGEAARRANRAFVLAQARDLVGAVFVDAGRDPWNTLYRALRPRTAAGNPANPPGVDPAEAASHAAFLARHPETRWLLAPKVKNTSDGNGNAVANAARPSAEPGPAPAAFASRVAEVAANALAAAMRAATRAGEAELSQSDGGAGSGSGSSASPLSPPRQWFHVDASDLAAFDEMVNQSLYKIEHIEDEGIDEDLFADLIFEVFTVKLSDDTEAPLCDGGEEMDVTWHNRKRYCDMVRAARLREGRAQAHAVLRGISSMLPARLLPLFSWHEFELMACGAPDVDIDVLKAHTKYGVTVDPHKDPHIKLLWQVLEAFTGEQRSLFLTFIWGRNRLPLTEDDWGEQHMRIHTLETRRPDGHFPVAHTCFFSLELPAYTTAAICHARLLYAITHCQDIDVDTTSGARENRDAAVEDEDDE